MTTWYDLPREVHDQILRFFCLDIIDRYKTTSKDSVDQALDECCTLRPNWTNTPAALKDLYSAIRTCRSFYRSIVHIIKIDDETPIQVLQEMQRNIVEAIVLCDTGHAWPIGVCASMAGFFWRNPEIHMDVGLMIRVLSMLAYENLAILLPHLEEWVAEHATPALKDLDIELCELSPGGRGDVPDYSVVVQPGSYEIKLSGNRSKYQAIRSINGLYEGGLFMKLVETDIGAPLPGRNFTTTERGYTMLQKKFNNTVLAKVPLLREVHKAEPDTWWLFRISDDIWFLVDYGGKRFWGNFCKLDFCYWDDIWDPTSWKVGSRGRRLQRDWFLYVDIFGPADYPAPGEAERQGKAIVVGGRVDIGS